MPVSGLSWRGRCVWLGRGGGGEKGEEADQDLFVLLLQEKKKKLLVVTFEAGGQKAGVPLITHTPCKLLSSSMETCY